MTAPIPKDSIIIKPQPGPQEQFCRCDADVAFYGGSAGGGKSFALLLDPLYEVENALFGAVIFRRTMAQILKEGSLWDQASDLYPGINGKSQQSPQYHFKFPSGMKITFAHMEYEKNRFDWQGSQIPYIGFDEITHFTWKQFVYMLSRLRSMSGVRGMIRGTCNPDPDSWVRSFIDWYIGDDGFVIPERSGVIRWFVLMGDEIIWADSKKELLAKFPDMTEGVDIFPKSFTFIRSSIYDNKILLEKDPAYLGNLHTLPRVEKAQLLEGNWNIRPTAGSYFQRTDFEVVLAVPAGAKKVRAWDLAATKRQETKTEKERRGPAYTAGVKLSKVRGKYYVEDVRREREDPRKVDRMIKNTASQDGKFCLVRLPQDPGQAGKAQAQAMIRMLAGYTARAVPVSGSKEHRASPFAAQVQAGNVCVVQGKWNDAFFTELENFPEGLYADQVDAVSDAFNELENVKIAGVWGTKRKR